MSLEVMAKNIDPTAIYKAVKVTVKDDTANRYVDKGFSINGQAAIVKNPHHEDVYQLCVGGWNGLITSPVVKILQDGDNFIIETANSMYTLEKLS